MVLFLLSMCSFFFQSQSSLDFFYVLLEKAGISLGGRALYALLIKMGCSGGLALLLSFTSKALFNGMLLPELVCWMDNPGASSSKRPLFDLNLPPADEPASTPPQVVDQGSQPLSEAEEISFRLSQNGTFHNQKLIDEARAIARENSRSDVSIRSRIF